MSELYTKTMDAFKNGLFQKYYKITPEIIENVTGVTSEGEYAEELAKHVQHLIQNKKDSQAKEAADVLYDLLNKGEEVSLEKALISHPSLMDKLMFVIFKVINDRLRFGQEEHDFDARISYPVRKLITECFTYNRR